MDLSAIRAQLVEYGRRMVTSNLTTGSGGNLSCLARDSGRLAITPSGLDYFAMTADDIVICDLDGKKLEGGYPPSSELTFHVALYAHRPTITAVVHTHSVFATTLACLHREIPAVHYLVGFAGKKVPLAPYATFGTPDLARNIVETIGDSSAVLLANHGLVAAAHDLPTAFNIAEEIELVARIYYQTLTVGEPKILSDAQMDEVMEKFKTYACRVVESSNRRK